MLVCLSRLSRELGSRRVCLKAQRRNHNALALCCTRPDRSGVASALSLSLSRSLSRARSVTWEVQTPLFPLVTSSETPLLKPCLFSARFPVPWWQGPLRGKNTSSQIPQAHARQTGAPLACLPACLPARAPCAYEQISLRLCGHKTDYKDVVTS